MQDILNFLSNHPYLSGAIGLVLACVALIEFIRASHNAARLNTANAIQLINHQNARVIDIRSKEHFVEGHIIDAQSLPISEFDQQSKKLEKYKTRPIIIVCNIGSNSQKIAARLQKDGYNAYSLGGGMRGWIEASLPIIKG